MLACHLKCHTEPADREKSRIKSASCLGRASTLKREKDEMSELNHTGSQEESRLRGFHSFLLCVLDFVLLNVSFYALNYWKRGSFDLSSKYFNLLIAFYVIWFVVAIFTKKFKVGSYGGYWECITLYMRSGLYGAFCAAFVVVVFGFSEFSRVHALGIWVLLAILEGVIFTLYHAIAGKGHRAERRRQKSEKDNLSTVLLVGELPEAGEPLSFS